MHIRHETTKYKHNFDELIILSKLYIKHIKNQQNSVIYYKKLDFKSEISGKRNVVVEVILIARHEFLRNG